MNKKTDKLIADLTISLEQKTKLIKDVHAEMDRGLAGEKSSIKMLPAYIWPPTGNERGEYLAIDFGGTNLRVMLVKLEGQGKIVMPKIRVQTIGPDILSGTGEQLCGFIADAVIDFMQEAGMDMTLEKEFGFTFSFPMDQRSITSAFLISWTKGFCTSGMVGENVVALVQAAFAKRGFPQIRVGAIANDTVGTLAHGLYENSATSLGVIIGTGTNAAYVEKTSAITKFPALQSKTDTMMINMEWGGFDRIGRTVYDEMIDELSSNPGEQFLEKMVAARYLGDLVSLIINDLIESGEFSPAMRPIKEDAFFDAREVSLIAKDESMALTDMEQLLENHGSGGVRFDDRALVKKVAKLILDRSANIAATMMMAVVKKIDFSLERVHAIAIDGSLYEKAYGYKEEVRRAIEELAGEKKNQVKPFVCKDGSGVGVAVVAATVASAK